MLCGVGLLASLAYAAFTVTAVLRFPLTRSPRRGTGKVRRTPGSVTVCKPVRGFDPLASWSVEAGGDFSRLVGELLAGDGPASPLSGSGTRAAGCIAGNRLRSTSLRKDGTGELARDLALNLSSFFLQDYDGPFELLFGFQDPDDPAIPLVEALCRAHPQVSARVVRVPEAVGPNRKASVLAALSRVAEGELLVVSDQDMRVDPSYLTAVVEAFQEDGVGVVTCPYRTALASDLGGALEALTIDVDFIPSVLVARTLERGLSFALGATMAVRRTALEAIGGFEALVPYLADDYLLGNRAKLAGWRVEMSPYPLDNVLPPTSFTQYFTHQLRWARGYRVCRPGGYVASVITHGTTLALLSSLVLGTGPSFWTLLAAWLTFRLLVARFLFRRVAGRSMPTIWLPLVPFRDVLASVIWVLAVSGHRVEWGGRAFLLERDGRLREFR